MTRSMIFGAACMLLVVYTVFFVRPDPLDPTLTLVGVPHTGATISLRQAREADVDVAREYFESRLVGQKAKDVDAMCQREKGFAMTGLHHVHGVECRSFATPTYEIRYSLNVDDAENRFQVWTVGLRFDADGRTVDAVTGIDARLTNRAPF